MKESLGLVEIQGLVTAVTAADEMVKAANINIIELENAKGLGYITVKISGDIGAVNAAVSVGKQIALLHNQLISWKVIARPAESTHQLFGANKKEKQQSEAQELETQGLKPEAVEPEAVEPEEVEAEDLKEEGVGKRKQTPKKTKKTKKSET